MSFVLVFLMIFNVTLPAFANNGNNGNMALDKINNLPADEQKLLRRALENPEFTNIDELSVSNQDLIKTVTKDPNLYLFLADVFDSQTILIYDTPDSDVKVGITDGYEEVVKMIDEETFSINDEKEDNGKT
jgi:hypothetical protein